MVSDKICGVTKYTYDKLDRLIQIVTPKGETITFEYDSLGRRTKLIYPNNTITTYEYDKAGNLIKLKTVDHKLSTINEYSYTYDKVGNRTSMTTLEGTHTYSYDKLYRLISATYPQPENPKESFWRFDKVFFYLTFKIIFEIIQKPSLNEDFLNL